jgi:hypothetical protein
VTDTGVTTEAKTIRPAGYSERYKTITDKAAAQVKEADPTETTPHGPRSDGREVTPKAILIVQEQAIL